MEEDEQFQSDDNIETISDVDSIEDEDTMVYNNHKNSSEASSQQECPQYSLDNESLIVIDDSSSNSSLSDSGLNSKVRKKLIESNSIKIPAQSMMTTDEIEDDPEIRIFDQQTPIKRYVVSNAGNTFINSNLSSRQEKKDFLNLEHISFPKKIPYVSKLSPVNCSQIKKLASSSLLTTTSLLKPANTMTKLQPKSRFSEINYKNSFSGPKITSTNETKSEMYVIPHNGVKYVLRNENSRELKSQSLKSYQSMSSIIKSNNTAAELSEQKKKILLSTKVMQQRGDPNRMPKFVARMQKLPDGKYKMIPAQGKVPVGLENLFKRNSHFVKQKTAAGSSSNEPSFGNIIHVVQTSKSPYQMTKSNETRHFNHNRQLLSGKFPTSEFSKSFDYGNVRRNKLIPHTATSKDVIENHRNIVTGKGEIKIIANRDVCTSSGLIQLSPNTESPVQSDSQQMRFSSYGEFHVPKTKLSTPREVKSDDSLFGVVRNCDDENSSISSSTNKSSIVFSNGKRQSNDMELNGGFEKHSNKNEIPIKGIDTEEQNELSEEEDNIECGKFVCCIYEYCDTLVLESELIDNLYCSQMCKKLDTKHIEEPITKPKEITKPSKNQKELINKLENRTHKRKQLFTSSNREKKFRNNDWDDFEQLENSHNELSIDENLSPSNSPCDTSELISSPKAVHNDEDNNENSLLHHLKSIMNDERLSCYMDEMGLRSAPLKLFDKPFPLENNFFKVGHKLEGIDPEHEALFCVLTVAEVCGYRIKLHFDGYPNEYDFWANADSPYLFYPRWCEQNSRIVQPPNNYKNKFDWTNYLRECQAFPALKHYFASTKNLANCKKHKFCIGDKLEALDKLTRTLPKQLICVATIADILGDRIRIHFDGWTDDYDYWTDITSTNIHPIRWCEKNGRNLSPPSGYNDLKGKKPFNWTEYLQETNSKPVPEDAFVRRPLRDFDINMTIEVVDLVVPSLIRVAKVVDVRGDELKILYDGFHSNYAYWVEDDSPDIHPVGWSVKTNHPVELPSAKDKPWSCRVIGCNGKGNSSNLNNDHISPQDCPYEVDSWKKAVAGLEKLSNRLKMSTVSNITTVPSFISQNMEMNTDAIKLSSLNSNVHDSMNKDDEIIDKKSKDQFSMKRMIRLEYNADNKKYRSVIGKPSMQCKDTVKFRKHLGLSLLGHDIGSLSYAYESRSWIRHNAQLGIPLCNNGDVRNWSTEEVASYVNQVITANSNRTTAEQISIADRFVDQEIDGETFLMLTQEELLNILKVPLGQALKLINAIIMLRQRISAFDEIETCAQ